MTQQTPPGRRLAFAALIGLVLVSGRGLALGEDDDPAPRGFPPVGAGADDEHPPVVDDPDYEKELLDQDPTAHDAPIDVGGGLKPPGGMTPRDEIMRISLLDAVRLGMEANLLLREGSFLAPIARQAVIASDAAFDDLLTAEVEVGQTETPNNFFINNIVRQHSIRGSAGVARRTRTGGSIALLYRLDTVDSNSPAVFFNPAYTNSLNFEVMQPLLRGAGDIALSDLRRAQNGVVAARATYDTQIELTVLSIVTSYWELAFAYENLQAKRSSFRVSEEVLALANARLDAEKGTPLEVAEARAGLERRRSEVLQADNLIGSVSDDLLVQIMPFGAERHGGTVLKNTDTLRKPFAEAPSDNETQRLINEALRGRPEVRVANADIANRGVDLVQAANAVRPQLDLFGRLGTSGLQDSFGQSFEDLITGSAFSASVGVQFSNFVGQRAARSNWRAAGWARRQAMLRAKDLQNEIVQDVRSAVRDMRTAAAQVAAGKEEVRAATANLEGEQDKLKEGVSTPFQVLQREDDLRSARTRLARAAADIRVSRARLWRSLGMLTRNLGVPAPGWPGCRDCR